MFRYGVGFDSFPDCIFFGFLFGSRLVVTSTIKKIYEL